MTVPLPPRAGSMGVLLLVEATTASCGTAIRGTQRHLWQRDWASLGARRVTASPELPSIVAAVAARSPTRTPQRGAIGAFFNRPHATNAAMAPSTALMATY
jgi:hypothetical protein